MFNPRHFLPHSSPDYYYYLKCSKLHHQRHKSRQRLITQTFLLLLIFICGTQAIRADTYVGVVVAVVVLECSPAAGAHINDDDDDCEDYGAMKIFGNNRNHSILTHVICRFLGGRKEMSIFGRD